MRWRRFAKEEDYHDGDGNKWEVNPASIDIKAACDFKQDKIR